MRAYGVFSNQRSEPKIIKAFDKARKDLFEYLRAIGVRTESLRVAIVDKPTKRNGQTIATANGDSDWKMSFRSKRTRAGGRVYFFYSPFAITVRVRASKTIEFERAGNEDFVVTADGLVK